MMLVYTYVTVISNKLNQVKDVPGIVSLTFVAHHSVMQVQQKRWPQGVAVDCFLTSRHREHFLLGSVYTSSDWSVWSDTLPRDTNHYSHSVLKDDLYV